jgi:hypothetical protein
MSSRFSDIAAVRRLGPPVLFCPRSASTISTWAIPYHTCIAGQFPVCYGHSLPGPTILLGPVFQKRFLFRHAIFPQRVTLLQAEADFLLAPRYPRILSFLFWWRSAARLQTLSPFLGSPIDITASSS